LSHTREAGAIQLRVGMPRLSRNSARSLDKTRDLNIPAPPPLAIRLLRNSDDEELSIAMRNSDYV